MEQTLKIGTIEENISDLRNMANSLKLKTLEHDLDAESQKIILMSTIMLVNTTLAVMMRLNIELEQQKTNLANFAFGMGDMEADRIKRKLT